MYDALLSIRESSKVREGVIHEILTDGDYEMEMAHG